MLENLARAGAFDCLNANRAQVLRSIDLILSEANRATQERESQQDSLFGGSGGTVISNPALPQVNPWTPMEKLTQEFDAIGFYLSGHPLDDYMTALRRAKVVTYSELVARGNSAERIAGTVSVCQERRSKRGNPFAFVSLSDPSGQYEVVVFSEVLNAGRELLQPGRSVVLNVEIERKEDEVRLMGQGVRSVEEVVAGTAAGLKIFVDTPEPLEAIRSGLPAGGKGLVSLILLGTGGREVEIELPGRFAVSPPVRGAIRAIPGVVEVQDL